MADPTEMPTLEYASTVSLNELRGRRLALAFHLGLLLTFFVFAASACLRFPHVRLLSVLGVIVQILSAGILPLSCAFFIGVLARQRRLGHFLRYRAVPLAFVAGIVASFFTAFLSVILESTLASVAVGALMGWVLCYRGDSEAPLPLLQSRYRQAATVMGAIGGVYLALGFSSAWISRGACEQKVAHSIATDVFRGIPFHLGEDSPVANGIFRAAGIVPLPPGGSDSDRFPWADLKNARVSGPFMVSIEYGWTPGPLAGQGGQKVYFCLFGHIFEYRDDVTWIS